MSDLAPQLKYKLTRAATLLADSPIRDTLKETITAGIERLTERDLDRLIASLEYESRELGHLKKELDAFDKKQDEDWKKLEEQQKEKAAQMLEEFFKEIA